MNADLVNEARTLIAKLELVSNAPSMNYDSDHRGGESALFPTWGHRPAPKGSGPRQLGDMEPEFLLLRHRLNRALEDGNEAGVQRVRNEAARELQLARRKPRGAVVIRDTLQWKRDIANDTGKVADIARVNMVSRTTVYEYRRRYREDKAA